MSNMKNGLLAAAILAAMTGTAMAGDLPKGAESTAVHGGFEAEFGTRMWLGFGNTAKDLYGVGGSPMVSRLTYGNLPTAAGEIFGKVTDNRFFVSGFAGLGVLDGGTLKDEDFPPVTSPYSSTNSNQHDGSLSYATVDVGGYLYSTPKGRLGAFVGYNYLNQQLNAFGCTQTGANAGICVPSISDSVKVISQSNTWQSVRVGINGDMKLDDRWSINGDAAILPYVTLSGADTHWLRIPGDFSGPIPEDGTGWGAQIQAMLDYKVNDQLSLGVGGRYWHMQTVGNAHFEDVTPGPAQPEHWTTDLLGVLVEAKAHF
jgi:hypothetical protein